MNSEMSPLVGLYISILRTRTALDAGAWLIRRIMYDILSHNAYPTALIVDLLFFPAPNSKKDVLRRRSASAVSSLAERFRSGLLTGPQSIPIRRIAAFPAMSEL